MKSSAISTFGARLILEAIRNLKPDQCRELGELIIALGDSPRDGAWELNIQAALAKFPEPPTPTLVQALEAGRKRVQEANDELFGTGWHPDQMRRKLKELGYTGNEQPKAA